MVAVLRISKHSHWSTLHDGYVHAWQWVTATGRRGAYTRRHIVLDSDTRHYAWSAPQHSWHHWPGWYSCQESRTASFCWYENISVIIVLYNCLCLLCLHPCIDGTGDTRFSGCPSICLCIYTCVHKCMTRCGGGILTSLLSAFGLLTLLSSLVKLWRWCW